jgi:hypothetical protein
MLINHPKVIKELKRRSKGDPERYKKLRDELEYKIYHKYDFIIVEIDALAASKQHPKLLKKYGVRSCRSIL